jgi:hypothetical protein
LGDGGEPGVTLRYVECPDPDVGLARGVLLLKDEFREPFVTILGDELYLESNHRHLLSWLLVAAGGMFRRAKCPAEEYLALVLSANMLLEGLTATALSFAHANAPAIYP